MEANQEAGEQIPICATVVKRGKRETDDTNVPQNLAHREVLM